MPTIGLTELLVILLIVLLFFGPKNIPKLFKSLGEGMKSFKDAQKNGDNKKKEDEKEDN